jgi:hypothetical protein
MAIGVSLVEVGRIRDRLACCRCEFLGRGFQLESRVEAGSGIPKLSCSFSARWKGIPVPYFNRAIILPTVASRFSSPTPVGGSAVNTTPQRLQRSSTKVARRPSSGPAADNARPRTRTAGRPCSPIDAASTRFFSE